MAKNNFYGVKIGLVPGVYETWDECKTVTNGYPGAKFEGFKTREEAELYAFGEVIKEFNDKIDTALQTIKHDNPNTQAFLDLLDETDQGKAINPVHEALSMSAIKEATSRLHDAYMMTEPDISPEDIQVLENHLEWLRDHMIKLSVIANSKSTVVCDKKRLSVYCNDEDEVLNVEIDGKMYDAEDLYYTSTWLEMIGTMPGVQIIEYKDGQRLIKTWDELKECVSDTHRLEIEDGSGWIYSKTNDKESHYLSTHTFYGSSYKGYTQMLQDCGFNIQLANWDEEA